jgi:hypothetical protein
MGMLESLPGDTFFALGLAVQAICGVGVFLIGRWKALLLYVVLVPLYWIVALVLASGHLGEALDGVIVLPLAFLTVVFVRRVRAIDRGHENQ